MRHLTFFAAALSVLSASADLPVTLVNNTNGQFADDDIYVAILGEQKGVGYIYYDMAKSSSAATVRPLNESVNTLPGTGPFTTYADVFTKLSDIPGKVVYLGDTYACRMFISFKSPMYLHAFAQGYAGADLNNPSDPNASVRWELVEFTYAPGSGSGKDFDEIWINTTRVDAFQYPMGLELWSTGHYPYTKRGENVSYKTVIDKWNSTLGNTVYKDCLYNLITKDNVGGIIKQPSKVKSIKDQNIFDDYINKIWTYFSSHTANIDMGLLGRWTGKVEGEKFVLTCAEGHYWQPGSVATIDAKPDTEDVIEGAGVFASGSDISKTVQSMFCAAFNRGMIRATSDLQDWNPDGPTKAFSGGTEYPCNEYVKFFHDPAISPSGKTYAFSYDDTYDQSATCYANNPTRATVTIGGFSDSNPDPGTDPDPDPNPGTDPDPDPNPGTDPDNNQSLEKNFSADDHTQGNPFAGPYSLKLYPSEGGVAVVARFEGNYEGFDGPWLWNYTNGFEETKMTSAGDGSYRYLINNVAPGTTVTVAVKIAYAGGMSVSPQVSYVVPDKAQSVLPTVTLSSDPSSCKTGETVVFTANVKPGDSEVDAVVVRIDGNALVTAPVAGSENTKYSAQWTATSAGDHIVVAEVTADGQTVTSPELRYTVTAPAPDPVLPTVTLSSDPSSCLTGETVVFTADVNPGDFEVDAVVVRIDGNALVTAPVAGSENTKYSAEWTATSAGDHIVVAEVTAGGRTITSPELRYTVTAPAPDPVLPTVTLSSDPSGCKTGETVVFTADVNPGDFEVDAVVVRIDGNALVTTPVAGSENTKYSAEWTATSAGDHVVVAEVTAGGRTITSPELRYTVTASDPGNASLTTPGESLETLVIYPNPASSEIHLRTRGAGVVSLLSLDGNCIGQYDVESVATIDVSWLNPGLYFVRFIEDGGFAPVVKRLIIK